MTGPTVPSEAVVGDEVIVTHRGRLIERQIRHEGEPECLTVDLGEYVRYLTLVPGVTVEVAAAVPVLQAQERERIADMLQEFAEQWLYDGDHDQPLPGYLELHEIVRSLAVPDGERR